MKKNLNSLRRAASSLLLPVVLSCGLGLSGNSRAQSMGTAAYGTAAQKGGQHSNTRSLFLGTIAAMIAQSVGSGVGSALSDGLGGSITRWFSNEPATGANVPPPVSERRGRNDAAPRGDPRRDASTVDADGGPRMRKAQANSAPRELHAGVAFEVHRIDSKGNTKAVDSARQVFRTGDRFQVYYRPTLPGRVKVININPSGQKARIDTVDVAAGELIALGPYQFVDAKGDEILKLVLEPCSTPKLIASTRAIIKTAALATDEQPAVRIRDCGEVRTETKKAASRSIRKSTMDGSTAYALDRLSNEEVRSGNVRSRTLQITLRHR